MGHTAFSRMCLRSTKFLESNVLIQNLLNNIWPGNKHIAGVVYHKNKIGNGRRIYRPSGAGPIITEICGITPDDCTMFLNIAA